MPNQPVARLPARPVSRLTPPRACRSLHLTYARVKTGVTSRSWRSNRHMNIVVLIKQVPDTWSERKLSGSDFTLDRDAADAVLDEINERAVEAALQLQEANGGEVTVVCMGADKAVHLTDPALHGSCTVQTARALAKVIGTVGQFDLIVAGDESTDGSS